MVHMTFSVFPVTSVSLSLSFSITFPILFFLLLPEMTLFGSLLADCASLLP